MTARVGLPPLVLLLAVVVVLVSVVGVAGEAHAACAAPTLEVEPTVAAPGDVLEVRGRGYHDGCDDTGGREEVEPSRGIEIGLVQGDRLVVLARVDADASYAFAVRVAVPDGFDAGPAAVTGVPIQLTAGGSTAAATPAPTFLTGTPTGAGGSGPPGGWFAWALGAVVVGAGAAAVATPRIGARRRRRRSNRERWHAPGGVA